MKNIMRILLGRREAHQRRAEALAVLNASGTFYASGRGRRNGRASGSNADGRGKPGDNAANAGDDGGNALE